VKRLLVLGALGSLAALGTGCDVSPPAATAAGIAISQSQLNGELATVSSQPDAQCALSVLASANQTSLPTVSGVGDSTVTTQFAAYTLNAMIQQAIEQHELATRHVTLTAADTTAARQDFELQVSSASTQVSPPCGLSGASLVDRLPSAFVDAQARQLAYQERLEEVVDHIDVTPSGLLSYYRSHIPQVTQVCLNLIVVDSQSAAQAVRAKLASGTSVAQAAQSPGVDSGSPPGGQVACVYPGTVVSNFGQSVAAVVDALAVGQIAPVQSLAIPNSTTGATQTYWLVVQMRARQLVPFAQAEGDLRRGLLSQGGAALNTVIARAVAAAHVTIDPRYGTWNAARGVTVPAAPPASIVLDPSANQNAGPAAAPGGSGTPAG